jgi:hypothetical protein
MAVLRGMYNLLHITQPKVGSIRIKEKNRCHGCTERNVQCTSHHTTIRVKERNRCHVFLEECTVTAHNIAKRLDLLGLRKETGAMAVLTGMSSVLHIAQPKVGSIRIKEKNRCHGCIEMNVQCTAHHTAKRLDLLGLRKSTGAMAVLKGLYGVLHITQPKVGSIKVQEKNSCLGRTERNVHL